MSFFFGSKYGVNTACYNDTTCCIIKPHAVAEGKQAKVDRCLLKYDFTLNRKSRTNHQCHSRCWISSFCYRHSRVHRIDDVYTLQDMLLFQFSLDKVNAEEFLEVYKGVVHEYPVSNVSRFSHQRSFCYSSN